ncbi:hypothetical protein ONZ45_g14948 [Pleurotus djamor]|nr:hypothetical protein ONZ45_g14948 [Pleurotus djamor]
MSADMEPGRSNSGHLARRDNQSISSNHSGRGERSGSRSTSHPAVESAVTRLLVAIKQLLEALTSWSQLKMDENQVSDVYVRLGNDFNAAVAAFSAFNIDMRELLSVPEDLRAVLETCLAEDATPESLELYLPTSIGIGLINNQDMNGTIADRHEQTEFRVIALPPLETESVQSATPFHGAALSRVDGEIFRGLTLRHPPRFPLPMVKTVSSAVLLWLLPMVIHSARMPVRVQANTADKSQSPNPQILHTMFLRICGLVRRLHRPLSTMSPLPNTPPPPTPPAVPASVKRYSLVDKPMSAVAPPVVVEPSSPDVQLSNRDDSPSQESTSLPTPPPPPPPPNDILAGAEQASLAALKKSDALERRASKRFSTYHISRMTGGSGTTREKSVRGGNNANRRSLLAAGPTLTPGELAVLTEVDDEEVEPKREEQVVRSSSLRREGSARSRSRPKKDTLERDGTPPPPLPRTPSKSPEPTVIAPSAEASSSRPLENGIVEEPSSEVTRFPVFLQLGREVKKVVIEPGLSFASLRMLFVDKFSYNPGLENFPAIYIRDPSSGVQYELEDVDEVKDKCLLSLNIEPLDQIKQHIDAQISTLSQDIKELRSTVASSNTRPIPSPIIAHPMAESTPTANRPSDKQFQTIARRLSRFVAHDAPNSPVMPMLPQMTGQSLQAQMTGASVLSDYSNRVVGDLKTQFDEVQNLRRDLGVMRQLYTEFMKTTKESLTSLRTQTQSVKQVASTRVGGAREYIDTGKKKLDMRSQNVLTEVERLQDTVEGIKDDVLKKHITPSPIQLRNIKKNVDSVATELESLKEHMKTIKPMWKKTWAEELQNVVEEQHFMNHQEELLQDLLEDHKALVEVFGHVEKVISLRGSAPTKTRGYRPPVPDEGSNVNAVFKEIRVRDAASEAERRMKAIEASQKNRQKELESRTNELHNELHEFVGAKKLKMTGGAEEAERVRKRRDEMTLKAMFSGGSAGPASSASSSPYNSPDIRANGLT